MSAVSPRPESGGVLRVFVSSTFRDMFAEREELVKKVFPQLRRRCEERGISLVEIDLRWGITEEEARRGQVLPLCLEEADRCSIFLGVLGERYGWVPTRAGIDPELLEVHPWLREHLDDSVTEMEIWHGALRPRSERPCFFYLRDPASEDSCSDREGETESAKQRLARLKDILRRSELVVREPFRSPAELGRLILDDLSAAIDRLYPPRSQGEGGDEAATHRHFAAALARGFVGRQADFDRLDRFVEGLGGPLILAGPEGCGKSALLAAWVSFSLGAPLPGLQLRQSFWARLRGKFPRAGKVRGLPLLAFLVGADREMTSWPELIRGVLRALRRHAHLDLPLPEQPAALAIALPRWLALASRQSRIILVLDGLNHLKADDLNWLPEEVPANVRLIVSAAPGPTLDTLRKRNWHCHEVKPLDLWERERLLTGYLADYSKKLSPAALRTIVRKPAAASRLYLRTLAEELRVFGRHEELQGRIASYLDAEDVGQLFARLLQRLEADHKGRLVRDCLALLATSRRGLAEAELLDLLGDERGALPAARWAPLLAALRGSLLEQGGLLSFFHPALRQAVLNRYLPGEEAAVAHRRLADYFAARPWSPRKASEWPWQLARLQAWRELLAALGDRDYLLWAWPERSVEVKAYAALLSRATTVSPVAVFQNVLRDPPAWGATAWHVADLLGETGYQREALALAERLTGVARQTGDRDTLSKGLAMQAVFLQALGQTGPALRLLAEQEPLLGGAGERELAANLCNQGVLWRATGQGDRAMTCLRRAEELSRGHEDLVGVADALRNQAVLWLERGQGDRAEPLLREQEELCRKGGDLVGLQKGLGNQGVLCLAKGRWEEALRRFAEEEKICRRLGDRRGLHESLGNQAIALRKLGEDLNAVKDKLDEKEHICRELGDAAGLVDALKGRALVWAKTLKQPDLALSLLREALSLAVAHGLTAQAQDLRRLLAQEPSNG